VSIYASLISINIQYLLTVQRSVMLKQIFDMMELKAHLVSLPSQQNNKWIQQVKQFIYM
jgi:DNA-binding protein H-NS